LRVNKRPKEEEETSSQNTGRGRTALRVRWRCDDDTGGDPRFEDGRRDASTRELYDQGIFAPEKERE